MSTPSDRFHTEILSNQGERPVRRRDEATHRDRRHAYRVQLAGHPEATFTSPVRLTDISMSGVGFLARREDAALLSEAVLLVRVHSQLAIRARVQRIDFGASSKDWVRVGACFMELADEERATLGTLVTAGCS